MGNEPPLTLPGAPPSRGESSGGAQPALGYVEQAVADLRYYLLDGLLDAARFPVLAERRLALSWAAATLRIVGASHVCALELDGTRFSEAAICALLRPTDPMPRVTLTADAPGAATASFGAVSVDVRLDRLPLTHELGLWLASVDSATELHATYPSPGTVPGLTRLVWRQAPAAFALITYHSYPADAIVVRTSTRFLSSVPTRGEPAATSPDHQRRQS